MKSWRLGSSVRILLDTHALLWALLEPHLLSTRARGLLKNRRHEIFVSAATAWEISTKFRLGKLPDAAEVATNYLEVTRILGVQHLAVTPLHGLTAGNFQHQHKDPFDRMLAAQSLHESLTLLSKDEALHQFPIPVVWD